MLCHMDMIVNLSLRGSRGVEVPCSAGAGALGPAARDPASLSHIYIYIYI